MISFDVETDIKQHEIKQLVAISSYHQIFIRSIYLRNLKHAVKQACVFHVILLDIPSNSAKNRTRKGGEMVGGGGGYILNGQNPSSVAKVICPQSIMTIHFKKLLIRFSTGYRAPLEKKLFKVLTFLNPYVIERNLEMS